MKMEPNFQLAQTKLSMRHLAEHGTLDEIEKLLSCIHEVTPRIEGRIRQAKLSLAKTTRNDIHSESVRVS
jgi:hypothetical protein